MQQRGRVHVILLLEGHRGQEEPLGEMKEERGDEDGSAAERLRSWRLVLKEQRGQGESLGEVTVYRGREGRGGGVPACLAPPCVVSLMELSMLCFTHSGDTMGSSDGDASAGASVLWFVAAVTCARVSCLLFCVSPIRVTQCKTTPVRHHNPPANPS